MYQSKRAFLAGVFVGFIIGLGRVPSPPEQYSCLTRRLREIFRAHPCYLELTTLLCSNWKHYAKRTIYYSSVPTTYRSLNN